jgi:hypothetical protein
MSEMIRTQIELPHALVASLQERSAARGVTLTQQIIDVLNAYFAALDDPILRPDNPLFQLAGAIDSGMGNLAEQHDHYLYSTDHPKDPQ